MVHVRPAGALLEPAKEEALDELRDLTEELGGHFISLAGDDPAREIIDFAASHQITFIVLGQSARTRLDEILHGSIVTRIMRETRNIDVVIVADGRQDRTAKRRRHRAHDAAVSASSGPDRTRFPYNGRVHSPRLSRSRR